jgi:hypothetical protein
VGVELRQIGDVDGGHFSIIGEGRPFDCLIRFMALEGLARTPQLPVNRRRAPR